MLVLSRHIGEKIILRHGDLKVEVIVTDILGMNKVRLAIVAPRDVHVNREEIDTKIFGESNNASGKSQSATRPDATNDREGQAQLPRGDG